MKSLIVKTLRRVPEVEAITEVEVTTELDTEEAESEEIGVL